MSKWLEWILLKIFGVIFLGGVIVISGCMGVATFKALHYLSDFWLLMCLQIVIISIIVAIGVLVSFVAIKRGVNFLMQKDF